MLMNMMMVMKSASVTVEEAMILTTTTTTMTMTERSSRVVSLKEIREEGVTNAQLHDDDMIDALLWMVHHSCSWSWFCSLLQVFVAPSSIQ